MDGQIGERGHGFDSGCGFESASDLCVQVPVGAMGRLSESSVYPFKCLESGHLALPIGTPWMKGRPPWRCEPAGGEWRPPAAVGHGLYSYEGLRDPHQP